MQICSIRLGHACFQGFNFDAGRRPTWTRQWRVSLPKMINGAKCCSRLPGQSRRPRTPSSPQRASRWASLQICAAAKSHIQTETPSPSLPRAGIKASAQQDSFNYQVLSLCLGFQFLPAKLVMIFKMPAGKLRFLFSPVFPPHQEVNTPVYRLICPAVTL